MMSRIGPLSLYTAQRLNLVVMEIKADRATDPMTPGLEVHSL